jgi:SAM-dependent methyltransferase
MRQEIVQRLLHINHEFYQTFAQSFSATRQRLQPGVLKAIDGVAPSDGVLDLGCGNGMLTRELASRVHLGRTIGIDSSGELLKEARGNNKHPNADFLHANLSTEPWSDDLGDPFEWVFAFAVFHHIPNSKARQQLIQEIRSVIADNGVLTFSHWNFLSSARLRDRIVPWSRVEIDEDELEEGDYLLDWRRDGFGFRYVHAFETKEIEGIVNQASFEIMDHYESDGESGKLGSYYVCSPI